MNAIERGKIKNGQIVLSKPLALPEDTEVIVRVELVNDARLTNEERAKQFREWAESHSDNRIVLSDEAMNRESIYEDCR